MRGQGIPSRQREYGPLVRAADRMDGLREQAKFESVRQVSVEQVVGREYGIQISGLSRIARGGISVPICVCVPVCEREPGACVCVCVLA